MKTSEKALGIVANPSTERPMQSQRLSTCGMPCFEVLPFDGPQRLSTSGMPAFDGIVFPNN